jgi:undecaprenyl-diphosphatase
LPSAIHNDYLLSVILGIVEGLTEFLPVSSTAHLRIAEQLLHLPLGTGYWKMYSIVIQLGAILCLPVYFWPRIRQFLSTFPKGKYGNRNWLTHPLSLTMIAFVVTAIPAWRLTKVIGQNLDNFTVIGSSLFIGGIVMWIVDAIFGKPRTRAATGFDAVTSTIASQGKLTTATAQAGSITAAPPRAYRTEHMEEMTLWQSIWIGACQILSAVFPGVSRSMSTIAAGQVSGMSREAALEFSFFLSIPTMAVATIFTLMKALHPSAANAGDAFSPKSMSHHDWIILAIGFVVSFIVALGVVAWFMAWVRRRGFTPFAIYRIILGIGVLWWAYRTTHGG